MAADSKCKGVDGVPLVLDPVSTQLFPGVQEEKDGAVGAWSLEMGMPATTMLGQCDKAQRVDKLTTALLKFFIWR